MRALDEMKVVQGSGERGGKGGDDRLWRRAG